ncbi:MAG: oxygenase MpaB family protein [Sciscionella sp.]
MLEALKFEGDPLADAVISEMVASGEVAAVNLVLDELRANDQPIPENLPPRVRQYLIETDCPPDWTDVQRVARAHEFFLDDGMHVASVLSFGAMVNCYAQPRPSRVLSLTHRLEHPHRRLSETSQFVLNMMAANPFSGGGGFIPAIQKTRLIHAAVRHFITESGQWDLAADGVPICQQDLLGALLIFSVQVVKGMRRIGIEVTEQEAEDYYHVWRVAGALLGIRADAMPETYDEALTLNDSLVEASYAASPEGIVLTSGLVALYRELMPGKAFDSIIPAMVRKVVNPEVADYLQVPDSRTWRRVVSAGVKVMRVFERAEDDSILARKVLDKAAQLLLNINLRQLTNGQSTTLEVPKELADRWSIPR